MINVEDGFVYTETYYPTYKRFGNEKVEKTINIFIGHLKNPDAQVLQFLNFRLIRYQIRLTEHQGSCWFEWNPPHKIQQATIDPLLVAVQQFWSNKSLLVQTQNIDLFIYLN